MKPRRSERMQLVLNLALRAETQAAQNLGEAQKLHEAEQKRLADINQYYANYEKHFSERTQNLRASELASSRYFLSNLDSACQQQQLQVQSAEHCVDEARTKWRESHLKSDALDDFRDRCIKVEQQSMDKKEQAQMDELALRRPVQ